MGGQCSSKRESFHDAILKKDLKKVKFFIQNGLDVKNDLRALEVRINLIKPIKFSLFLLTYS